MQTPTDERLQRAWRHQQAGELDQADALCRELLAANPREAAALHLAGVIAHQRGQVSEAQQALVAAIESDPRQPAYYHQLGVVYHDTGHVQAARQCFEQALRLAPDSHLTHHYLGLTLASQQDYAGAARHLERAVRLDPENAQAHFNLGVAYFSTGNYRRAVACHRQALRLAPETIDFVRALAITLHHAGEPGEAIDLYRRYLEAAPGDADVRMNLATALHMTRHMHEAEIEYLACVDSPARCVELFVQMGNCAQSLGKPEEAVGWFRRAIALDPARDEPHYRLGAALMAAGDFQAGWPEYEWRLKRVGRQYAPRVWDGGALAGERIIVYAEQGQGLGDTLQFLRFLPAVRQRGGNVVLAVQQPLLPLLIASGYDQLISTEATAPACEWQVAMMSLPLLLGTTIDTIPAEIPYLHAPAKLIELWRERLQAYQGYRIGIHWHGSQIARVDGRVVRLEQFEPVANVDGVTLISLQKKEGLDQLADVADRFRVVDFTNVLDEENGPLMDSAAIMRNVDLVITNDTVTGHLAGALGVEVWGVHQYAAEWRWFTKREDSPWYPTMRLFRQKAFDDWTGVFETMAAEVARRVAQRTK